jgi:polyphosphate kinase
VLSARVRQDGLAVYLNDEAQAWELKSDGKYQHAKSSGEAKPRCAQEELMTRPES